MRHPEQIIQEQVVRFLQLQYSKVLFTASIQEHAGHGKFTNIGMATRRKRMGYQKGTPDLVLYEPHKDKHALFIEMKSAKGVLSPEQKTFLAELEERGYATLVCHSLQAAVDGITEYLKDK